MIIQMDHQPTSNFLSFSSDALYCYEEEEKLGVGDEDFADSQASEDEIDHVSDDEELLFLLSKEKEQKNSITVSNSAIEGDSGFSVVRQEAVEWILKINGYYGFSTLTAILAVNYLDRFLANGDFQKEKQPWMIHLASVTSLSLAAKVEETYVPLLLDLQVESKDVFESKAIMKMELLMLSTLDWRMNVITPISFLQNMMKRIGLKNRWDFLRSCERLLLILVADFRVVNYEASVLATCIMLHVIHQTVPSNAIDYQNKLLQLHNICKTKMKECYELISQIIMALKSSNINGDYIPSSPKGVIDGFFVSSDGSSSNDSWTLESSNEPPKKKIRIQEQQMRLPSLPLNRLFIEVVGSPN